MEWIETESKPGYYNAFKHENGDTYLVLDGLSPNMIHTPGTLESFMLEHYGFFALLYWGLALATFVYLIGIYIVIPLYLRVRRGLPFFAEQ